jgi:transposase
LSRGGLTEGEWRVLKVSLPVERGPGKRRRGRPPEDNLNIINGILWLLRTGAPWRDVPEKYGHWNPIYRHFRRWSTSGVWESVVIALAEPMPPGFVKLPSVKCSRWI